MYVVRLCNNYDKVDLDEVMEWAADGGHEDVVRLCRELRATNFDWAILWAASWSRKHHVPV